MGLRRCGFIRTKWANENERSEVSSLRPCAPTARFNRGFMMEWYAAYLLLGAFVGFFAGLFGIGGGLVLVPVLSWLFEAQHIGGAQNLHLALGTSMAAILYTAAASAYAHHSRGAVNMHI